MEDIIEFSNQLQGLIEENKRLKDELKRTEEWFKLAICLKGNLQFRTIENADEETYKYFIKNTSISYGGNSSGGLELVWNKQIPVEYNGRTVSGLLPVEFEEIEKIFNSKV